MKSIAIISICALFLFGATACTMQFGQPEGPDSGEEIDLSDEPSSPDSGEEIDLSDEPSSPDSGEEIDTSNEPTSPDSGEEIDLSDEPTSPDSGEEVDPNEPTSPDSGEEVSLSDDLKSRAKGSCNRIDAGSTCVEYIGSYWGQGDNAGLNCADGFARTACPRPALGGCRLGVGTPNEIVTWHYSYGGDPYTEVLPYAIQSCRALPRTEWVEY